MWTKKNSSFLRLDDKVEMRIVPYILKKDHHGRRGSPPVQAGTQVYLLEYETGGYFTYSYLEIDDARLVIANGNNYDNDTKRYMEFNLVIDPEDTMHVSKRFTKANQQQAEDRLNRKKSTSV